MRPRSRHEGVTAATGTSVAVLFPRFPPRRFRHDRHRPRPTARERRPRSPAPQPTPAPRPSRRRSERPSPAGPDPGPAATRFGPDARQRGGRARARRVAGSRRARPRETGQSIVIARHDDLAPGLAEVRVASSISATRNGGTDQLLAVAPDAATAAVAGQIGPETTPLIMAAGGRIAAAGRAARPDRRRLCAGLVVAGRHRRPRRAVAGGGGRRRRRADRRRAVHRPADHRGRRVGPGAARALGRGAVSVRAGARDARWHRDHLDDRGARLWRPAHGRRQPGSDRPSAHRHRRAAAGRRPGIASWPTSVPTR